MCKTLPSLKKPTVKGRHSTSMYMTKRYFFAISASKESILTMRANRGFMKEVVVKAALKNGQSFDT